MRTILVPNFLNIFLADILNCYANKRMWQLHWVETVVLARPWKRPRHLARQIRTWCFKKRSTWGPWSSMRTERKALCTFLYCIRVHAILGPLLLLVTQFCCGGLDAAKSMGLDMVKSMGLDAAKSWLSSLRNPSNWHFRPKVWENYNDHI